MNSEAGPVIHVKGLWKTFDQHVVLEDVNLEVGSGEVLCIIGPSGSGKSTLLRCLNYLETPTRGEVWVNRQRLGFEPDSGTLRPARQRTIDRMRAEVGLVFQLFNLWPHKTVLGNITEAPRFVRGLSREDATRLAMSLLDRVGLADKAHAYPETLSGGQKQRVAIARALAMQPKVMLFDEVTSALDLELIAEVLDVMKRLAKDGMTMVVVTHEMGFARDVGHRIAFMDAGRIVEVGAAAQFFTSCRQPRTKEFLKRVVDRTG